MSFEIVNLYPYGKNNVYTIYVRNKFAVKFISGTPKTKINSFDLSSQKKKKTNAPGKVSIYLLNESDFSAFKNYYLNECLNRQHLMDSNLSDETLYLNLHISPIG